MTALYCIELPHKRNIEANKNSIMPFYMLNEFRPFHYFFQRVDTGRACKFLPKDTGSLPVYRMMPR